MTMPESSMSVAQELGKALGEMYQWNNSSDVEALQTLLCINMLADSKGYAQLVDVRREVGMAPDRMTRCLRLLMGQQKSHRLTIFASPEGERAPLIDVAAYEDSPTVKRVALTPRGKSIVDRMLMPALKRQERIDELEAELEAQCAKHANLIKAIEGMGYDAEKLSRDSYGENAFWHEHANEFIKAVLTDLSSLSPQEIYGLDLPTVQHSLMRVPGFSPDKTSDNTGARKQLGFLYAMLNHTRKSDS